MEDKVDRIIDNSKEKCQGLIRMRNDDNDETWKILNDHEKILTNYMKE